MFTTSEKREVFTIREETGRIGVQYEHVVQVSSKNYTTELEFYHIIDEKADNRVKLERRRMLDLYNIMTDLRNKGQL